MTLPLASFLSAAAADDGAAASDGAPRAPPTHIFTTAFETAAGEKRSVAAEFGRFRPSFLDARTLRRALRPVPEGLELAMQVGFSGRGAGAQFHTHGAAWNALAHGRRAWVLVPPRASVVSSMPAAQFIVQLFPWLVGKNAPGTVRRCVQRDGDVLVLPDRWAHLTYNLRASTGLAREFDLR